MKKKHSLFLLLPAVAMVATGCFGKKDPGTNTGGNTDSGQTDDDHGGGEQQTVAVTGVSLNKNAATIEVGETETLVATVAPENATNKNVTWESSAPAVATVADGVVTAVAPGNAVIKVKTVDGNKEAICAVTVNQAQQEVVLQSITVGEAHRTFEQNDEFVGETITAHYSDGSTKTVEGTFSGYNLATLGEQTVNVSYTEQGVTKTATYKITVNERAPEVEGAVYTFTNSDGKALNMSTWNSDEFMNHVVLDGAPIITGMANPVNSYIGANGGSGDAAWNIWNCLKVGKSSGKGSLTLTLHPEATFSKIKMEVIGSRDDGTLTVNGITKDVPKKAIKDDLEPITLYFNISENTGELNISSKDMASNNYAISILRIAFIDGTAPLPAPVLDSLEVTQAPNKVNYFAGDNFDPTGMIITAKYTNNGEDKVIPATDYSIDKTALALGDDHVTVSYTEDGITKTVNVNVNVTKAPVPVTGVTLNQTELSIKVNDADATLVATVAPEDADDKTVVWSVSEEGIVTVNNGVIHAVAQGTVTVTATAGDFHAECVVTVGEAEKVISGIEVVEQPTKTNYYVGDVFDPAGMEIKVTYSSGHDPLIITSGYTYSSALLELGTEAMDIEYNGFHTSVAITVEAAPVLTSISVTGPTKTEYNVGEALDLSGLVVTANFDKGEPQVITEGYETNLENGKILAVDDTSLVVTYDGQTSEPIALTINVPTAILAEGTYLIKGYNEDGSITYYMKENGTASPLAVTDPDEATPFVFTLKEGTINEYTIQTLDGKTLYSTKDNAGVRIAENKEFTWIIEEGVAEKPGSYNLKQTLALDSSKEETARYLTLYNESDFRTYNSATAGNRKANTDFEVYHEKTLESISVTNQPTKNSYYVGETFNPEGLAVNAHYVWEGGGEENKAITDYTLDFEGAFTADDVGTKTITVSFGEKTATFDVTVEVKVAVLTSVEIVGTPQTEYSDGDLYNHEGLQLIAHYNDESELDVTDVAIWSISKETAAIGDESIQITASYENLEDVRNVDVTVTAANLIETVTVGSLGIGKSYGNFSAVSAESGILFEGNATTSSQGNIQIRDAGSQSGIYTRNSNRYVRSVTIEFDNANSKTVSVYGQVDPYTGISATATGDLLGQVTADGKIIVEGNYLNILIVSTGATYIKDIIVEWGNEALEPVAKFVTLNKNEEELAISGQSQLSAVVEGITPNQAITWTSDNPSVATVDENGLVTAVGGGTATITAAATQNPSIKADCIVKVSAESKVYTKVTSNQADWSGTYILVYEGGSCAWTGVDTSGCSEAVTIANNSIENPSTDIVTLNITKSGSGYAIQIVGGTNNGKYLKGKVSSGKEANGTNFNATAVECTITIAGDGSTLITSDVGTVMRYNNAASNGDWFRFYKSTSYTNQQAVYLYKLG